MKQILGLVPAAGVGARMGADRPKQYLALGRRSVLEWAVRALLADPRVARVFVVVAPHDERIAALALPARCEALAVGGATRAQSVRNGLQALASRIDAHDWVLVHDAARPCLEREELAGLIDGAGDDEAGALLALPMSDTVKREERGRAVATVERAGLWRALTPQFFRVDVLARALAAHGADPGVSDEASAVERLGLRPRLILGRPGNIKVTEPGDLALAEAILRQQGSW